MNESRRSGQTKRKDKIMHQGDHSRITHLARQASVLNEKYAKM